jgi:hypothetical protein
MIAFAKRQNSQSLHERFTELLPSIHAQLNFAFRQEPRERKEEMTAEAIASCWVAFVKLIERGLDSVVYATPLAQFAIRQVYEGRKVGGKLNQNDVSSVYAQRKKQFTVERLDRYDKRKSTWVEILVEDRKSGPADIAAARIDFEDWLRTLSGRRKRIAETLAAGETTSVAAAKFRVSRGRISQLRRELHDDWERFQGESEPGEPDEGSSRYGARIHQHRSLAIV